MTARLPRIPLWAELGFLALAALLLALLARARGDLLAAVLRPESLLLLPGFALALAIAAARWRLVLAGLGAPVSYGAALKANIQSLFFYFFLPMGAGAELYRAGVIGRSHRVGAARMGASVILDRFAGLITFSALALILFPLARPSLPALPFWALPAAALAAVAGAATLLAFKPARARLARLGEAVAQLTPARLAGALGFSFASSVLLAATAVLAGSLQGVGDAPGLAFAFSAAAVTAVIPLSLFGVTFTEVTGVALYQGAGASLDQALAIAASIYLMRLVMAGIGGAWILAERFAQRR